MASTIALKGANVINSSEDREVIVISDSEEEKNVDNREVIIIPDSEEENEADKLDDTCVSTFRKTIKREALQGRFGNVKKANKVVRAVASQLTGGIPVLDTREYTTTVDGKDRAVAIRMIDAPEEFEKAGSILLKLHLTGYHYLAKQSPLRRIVSIYQSAKLMCEIGRLDESLKSWMMDVYTREMMRNWNHEEDKITIDHVGAVTLGFWSKDGRIGHQPTFDRAYKMYRLIMVQSRALRKVQETLGNAGLVLLARNKRWQALASCNQEVLQKVLDRIKIERQRDDKLEWMASLMVKEIMND